MGWVEALALIIVAGLGGLTQVIVSRSRNGKPVVTDAQVDSAQDPGREALSSVLVLTEQMGHMSKRLSRVEQENADLARENRTFRRVILSVMDMLRRKPPATPEQVLAYILEHLPHIGKDKDL